jgi:hypothetical protein
VDPEETLRAALRHLEDGDLDDCRRHLEYYRTWRSGGGFEPHVDGVPGDKRCEVIGLWLGVATIRSGRRIDR